MSPEIVMSSLRVSDSQHVPSRRTSATADANKKTCLFACLQYLSRRRLDDSYSISCIRLESALVRPREAEAQVPYLNGR